MADAMEKMTTKNETRIMQRFDLFLELEESN